ncbi:MAG: hypothetical protein JWL97_28 [Gemmatimonadales bacterium]|jgi:uncharacterized protein YbcV (DUF1398 family)|nr:hypothetical protein [Gemmatimonadales bacterium]
MMLGMSVVLAVIGTVLTVGLWLWWKTGSVASRLDSPTAVRDMLAYLMTNGVDQAELRFQIRGVKDMRLVLKKYDGEHGAAIQSVFERKPSMATAFEDFRRQLEQRGISYRIKVDERRRHSLIIDHQANLVQAETVVGILFGSVFRVDLPNDGVAYFKYVITGKTGESSSAGARPA